MRPLLIFYVLVFYILFQFGWWAYLLIDLNKEVYLQKIELLKGETGTGNIDDHYLIKKMHERWWMVASEGAVFLGLLLLGIFITRKAIDKEVALARQQKNFILSVTHEFKSPLAAIRLNLQTLQRHNFEKEKQHVIINQAIHETDRINTLVENALMAARIEGHHFEFAHEDFSLGELLRSILQSRTNFSSQRKMELDVKEEVLITGDQLAITSAILNLVENAEKYSPEESVIKVEVKKSNTHGLVTVSDYGSGIPDTEKEKIFEKFYRIGNEDTRKSKGTGLGLFIVKHIVAYHKGNISLRHNSPKGSIFELSFPLAK
jgi:two-component system phosphate regulon sensor histidine kinase PhoR